MNQQLETMNLIHESKKRFLTPHFALSEFTESRTAHKYSIRNDPSSKEIENLRRLCQYTLEPLREILALPVIITSGYRCQALNHIIAHGARRSQHLNGQAADFYVGWSAALDPNRQHGEAPSARERLIKAFRLIITDPSIDYDQLIVYPNFIHVSYLSPEANRHKLTKANGHGTYCALSRVLALGLR